MVETYPCAVAVSSESPWYTSSPSKNVDVITFAVADPPNDSVNTCWRPVPALENDNASPSEALAAVIASFNWSSSSEFAVPDIA